MRDLRDYTIGQFEAFSDAAHRRTARTRIAAVIDGATASRGTADHFKQAIAALEAATHG